MAAVRVEFTSVAAAEVQAARDWYAGRSAMAALAFADEVSAAIDQIRDAPYRWPKAIGATRRHVFRRFPFAMIYRIKGDSVQIVAVAHAKRRPGYWKPRLKRP